MKNRIFNERVDFNLDASISGAFTESLISQLDVDNIYSVKREYLIATTADDIFDFYSRYPGMNYRVFNGYCAVLWTDKVVVTVYGGFYEPHKYTNTNFENDIIVSGDIIEVQGLVDAFDKHYEDRIIPSHHVVSMVVDGQHGLEKINLPVKLDRKFYPEMYPCIADPNQFISDYLNSDANVLILMGPAGLGKSALINEIILRAEVSTSIVFDINVMRNEKLYTDFISQSLRGKGGLMIMEDSDLILMDRTVGQNEMMSKLLNLSDGIVNTSGAKFIFSANITNKDEIDHALIRPGRCFDVVEFRNLTRKEAQIAADAVGKELFDDSKDEFTVAEIFNSTANRRDTKMKVGFV